MIDYAHPVMMAQRAMKDLHQAALENNFDAAIEHGIVAITEMRLTINALKDMKDKQNALRQQTKAIQKRVSATKS